MCASNASYVEILTPSGMVLGGRVFGRLIAHSTFMKGFSAYRRDPTELPCPSHHVRTQREVCGLEEGPTLQSWSPDLGLPASRTMRNKFLFFVSCPVCGT